jgi:hypothetical protein
MEKSWEEFQSEASGPCNLRVIEPSYYPIPDGSVDRSTLWGMTLC